MTVPVQAEPLATRREVDQLRQDSAVEHAKLWARIETMDDHGTRGVSALAVRMDGLIKDVADLKTEVKTDVAGLQTEMNTRFEAHQRVHDKDAEDRRDNRRWRIMAAAAVAGGMGTMIGLLVEIMRHLH